MLGYQTLRKNVHLKMDVRMYEYDMNFTAYGIFWNKLFDLEMVEIEQSCKV